MSKPNQELLFRRMGGKCFWCKKKLVEWDKREKNYKIKKGEEFPIKKNPDYPTVEHIFFRAHYLRTFYAFNDQRKTIACPDCNMGRGGIQSKATPEAIEEANKSYLKLNSKPPKNNRLLERDFKKTIEIVEKHDPQFRLVLFSSYLGRRLVDYYLKYNQIECADDYDKYLKILSKEFAEFISECGIK